MGTALLLVIHWNVHHKHKKCWRTISLPPSCRMHACLEWCPVPKKTEEHVCVYVVCMSPSASFWLTVACLGCTNCFWIWVMQVHEFNQVQSNFKVTRTSLCSPVPTPRLDWCQPLAAISLFGNITGRTKTYVGLLKPKQSGATWCD